MTTGYVRALLAASLLALPLAVQTITGLMWPGPQWVGPTGTYFGINFVNFWTAGRLANAGDLAAGYDHQAFITIVQSWFVPADKFTNLSYPPSLVPFLQPFGAMPYLAALAVWSAVGIAAFVAAVLWRVPRQENALLLVAILISPIVINNVMFGSIGLFMALLFVSAMRVLPSQQVLGGVLIGLLTVKPQLGVLLPLVLVVLGHWRAIGAAVVTAAALALFSIALHGIAPWQVYVTETVAMQWGYVHEMTGFFALHMSTIYAGLVAMGVSKDAAMAAHWASAVAVAITIVATLRSNASWPLKSAIVALGSVMIMPYVLGSDLAAPLAAMAWYLSTENAKPSATGYLAAGLLWLVPFPLIFVLQSLGVPVAQIAIVFGFGWMARTALRRERGALPIRRSAGAEPQAAAA